jgi:hypothetical protein
MTASYLTKNKMKQNPQVQGFITNLDRFVGRSEAFDIAEKAKQILNYDNNTKCRNLISEDLY